VEWNIHDHTIYIVLAGSHAYGTSRPDSDVDMRGICIPPREYFLGFEKNFEQFEGEYPRDASVGGQGLVDRLASMVGRGIPQDEKIDSTVFGLRKFMKLAADCNPNIIEILFSDSCQVLVEPLMEELLASRDLFLSAKAKYTFCGYAQSQLKRIRTHRRWLLNPPARKPNREEYGLSHRTVIPKDQMLAAESLIKKKVGEWLFLDEELPRAVLDAVRRKTVMSICDMWAGLQGEAPVPLTVDEDMDVGRLSDAAGRLLGFSDNFLEYLDRERRYKARLREYKQYQNWKKTRNPARAELEAKYGFDSKNAMHLVRLLKMSSEILKEGKVVVKRPDADELLAIRNGAWSFDEMMEWSEKQHKELDEIYENKTYVVPYKPNRKAIDRLCIDMVEKALLMEGR